MACNTCNGSGKASRFVSGGTGTSRNGTGVPIDMGQGISQSGWVSGSRVRPKKKDVNYGKSQ